LRKLQNGIRLFYSFVYSVCSTHIVSIIIRHSDIIDIQIFTLQFTIIFASLYIDNELIEYYQSILHNVKAWICQIKLLYDKIIIILNLNSTYFT